MELVFIEESYTEEESRPVYYFMISCAHPSVSIISCLMLVTPYSPGQHLFVQSLIQPHPWLLEVTTVTG